MISLFLRFAVKCFWVTIAFCSLLSYASAELQKIDKLKAAYMFNFTKFISWGDTNNGPIHFCVHRSPELESFLVALITSREKDKSTVVVSDTNESNTCDIIYLTDGEGLSNEHFHNSVLVTSNDVMLEVSPVIRFFVEEQKLRFEIDLEKAQELNVKISSKLIQVARVK